MWHLEKIKVKEMVKPRKRSCGTVVHWILCSAGESISTDVFDAYSQHAYPIDAFVFMIPLLIPYYKSMPSPTTSPTACLTGFSHLGEVKWRSHCSITSEHYTATWFLLVKVLPCCSFYSLVHIHSSNKIEMQIGEFGWLTFLLASKTYKQNLLKNLNLSYIKSTLLL